MKLRYFIRIALLALVGVILWQTRPFMTDSALNAAPATETGKKEEAAPTTAEKGGDAAYLAEGSKFSLEEATWEIWLLIGLFLLALAVTVERAIVLAMNKGKNDQLVDLLTKELKEGPKTVGGLIQDVGAKQYGMEGQVAALTLEGWEHGPAAMSKYAEASMESQKRKLEKRLVVLSTLGNNTPFIGLLGTVLGIMKAFGDMATRADAGPQVIMKGISDALWATAFGLGVAIPCVISYNALSKVVKAKLSSADEIVSILAALRVATSKKKNKD